MQKLWQKKQLSSSPLNEVSRVVEDFTSRDDVILDNVLVPHDIVGTAAHVRMLTKVGLLKQSEADFILKELTILLNSYQKGKLVIQFGDEDVHTRIEQEISKKHSDIGGKIHTGRSRNDQVLTDIRLYSRTELSQIGGLAAQLAQTFLFQAQNYQFVPMPGYTHLQPAMLSSVGMWLQQYAESLLDDLVLLQSAYELNDQSPLGSGAGYGVALPLDRAFSAKLLGFSRVQQNALYCQNSRGKVESAVIGALAQIMLTCSRFAQDMLLFTMNEFQFFALPDEFTTGSSIMPQKRNYDVMELIRGRAKLIIGYQNQVQSLIAGLPSGYNRDLQEIKRPLFESVKIVEQTLTVLKLVVSQLQVNEEALLQKIPSELFAAHHAYQLVTTHGMPFREAYRQVGNHLDEIPHYDPRQVVKEAIHLGATGNLAIKTSLAQVKQETKRWQKRQQMQQKIISTLLSLS